LQYVEDPLGFLQPFAPGPFGDFLGFQKSHPFIETVLGDVVERVYFQKKILGQDVGDGFGAVAGLFGIR